jgi:hypothetical protein
MPRVTVEANELTDVDVEHVSMVKAGANRVPFRLLKSQEGNTMLNLNAIGRSLFKKADTGPRVAAIMASKTADLEVVKAAIKAAGFSIDKMEVGEDTNVFMQGDLPEKDDVSVIKMSDTFAVVCGGLRKQFESMNFESTSFQEMLGQEGLYGSVGIASECLRATFSNIMSTAKSPEEAVGMVEKAIGDYQGYVTGLIKGVPVTAFKFDDYFKAADAKPAKDAAKPAADPAKAAADAAAKTTADAATKVAADAAQAATKADPALAAMFSALTKSVETVGVSMRDIGSRLTALDSRMGEVEKVAKSAGDAVKGKVLGGAGAGDKGAVTKNGVAGASVALIDTAFARPR